MKKCDIKNNQGNEVINLKINHDNQKKNYRNLIDLKTKKLKKPQKFRDIGSCKNETATTNNSEKKEGIKGILNKALPGRKFDLFQMGIFGIILVFLFITINIYYQGRDLKNDLLTSIKGGFNNILMAKDHIVSNDFSGAKTNFYDAISSFQEAENKIKFLKRNLADNYSKDSANKMIDGVFVSGNLLAEAGLNFTKAIENIKFLSAHTFNEAGPSLTEGYRVNLNLITDGKLKIIEAQKKIQDIPRSLIPGDYLSLMDDAQQKITKAVNLIEEAEKKFPIFLTLLGDKLPQRYLVLFQNIDEKRPTGGFIGSFAIIDINDGYVTKFDIHDVYDFDGRFHDYIEPPQELQSLTKTWRLRDSNYSPDFAVSAAKAEWFLQKEGGPSADHVIAIDQTLLVDIIEATGDLNLPGVSRPVSAADLNFLLSYIVESKIEGATTPKKILKDLKPAIIEKIKNPQNLAKIAPILIKGIREKHIQMWSKNPEVQEFFEQYKLAGRIYQNKPREDYLNVIDINVGGNKSDKYIERKIEHITFINREGKITNNLIITKTHTFTADQIEVWQNTLRKYGFNQLADNVNSILGNSDNLSIEKVYLPSGSKLITIEGVDGQDENTIIEAKYDSKLDKTYLTFKMKVAKGEQSAVSLTYTLPYDLKLNNFDDYFLYYQNQAANPTDFTKQIILDQSLTVHKTFPEEFKMTKDKHSIINFQKTVTSDFHLSAAIEG